MEYLNWMAEHWLLTIVLIWIVTGSASSTLRAALVALASRGK